LIARPEVPAKAVGAMRDHCWQCLDLIWWHGLRLLRTREADWPHQGIAQRVPDGKHDGGCRTVADLDRGRILRRPVLGGLINEYSRAA
jgi:hypothetical protein